MRTIEEAATAGSRRARVVRDLRVLRRMLGLLRAYFVSGALVRRRYRQRERRGEVFFVDEELGR
ncbi:MAG TPA: hypothetical protein VJ986_05055 [Gaiellaceae bacterium]|nr:hypothetical protein [Gaiellaceae bacterium]